jgi:hypothetical protein
LLINFILDVFDIIKGFILTNDLISLEPDAEPKKNIIKTIISTT